MLCELLGLPSNLRLWESFNLCEKRLRGSKRLLIVDEAEGISIRSLNLLRRLNDFCGVGIALVGLPGLIGMRDSRDGYEYLFSRIGMVIQLNAITKIDCENLIRCWLPSYVGLTQEFWCASSGNPRRLSKIIKLAEHISELNECLIDKDVISTANELLIS